SKNDSFSSLKKLTNVFKLPSQNPPISSRNTAKLQRKKNGRLLAILGDESWHILSVISECRVVPRYAVHKLLLLFCCFEHAQAFLEALQHSHETCGAISNMYAMLLARFKMFPEVKEKGMSSVPRLVAFTSEHSHFSIKKGAAALGIGTESVICIKVDESGKMIPADLERRIVEAKQKGFVPFFVSATAGTTVYGAFDPLIAISDVCKKYNVWMHVDGAWGGSLLMSRRHRWKLDGVDRANSVTWNPHKMMSVPLQCSALLVREEGLMQNCNQMHACYLFQQDKHYDLSYDTGDKALQCGRHVDIFKLWLMWRAKGTIGFEAQIDKCLELSEYLYNKIKDREGYEMVFDGKPQHTNVCFWYLPPGIRYMEDKEERKKHLHKVAPVIKARMMEYGTTMVSYQPQGDKVNFFRMVISNPAATFEDIDFLIEEIERLGQDL
uniref:Glutamate decarboxylase 2 n=1 Tax=Sparus aurata TaxID=8175 RepID=A0A671X4R1_SPAAU